jgi:hypothetical protein
MDERGIRINGSSLPVAKKIYAGVNFLKGPPQMPLSLRLEPKAQVVAFRAHQALPVGRAQQYRYGSQPKVIIGSKTSRL